MARARYYSTHFNTFQPPRMDEATFRYYRKKLGATLPADRSARILEVGCGLGKFLATLERLDYTAIEGVDVSEEMTRLARDNTSATVTHAPDIVAYLATLPGGAYDRVYLLDVIEHVDKSQVIEFLAELRQRLRPGGMAVITTENMASPIGRLQRYLDFTHEYNYTELTLRQVLQLAGFTSVSVSAPPDPLPLRPSMLAYWLSRRVWFATLNVLNRIERPGGWVPSVLDKDLLACAKD